MLTRLPETWAGTLLNALTMSANPSRTKPTSGTVATVDRDRPLPLAKLGTSWLAMLSFAADSDQCGQLAQHISNHRRLGAQRSTRIVTKFVDEILPPGIRKDVLPDRSNDDRAAVQARARHPRGCARSASSLLPERRGCARPGSAAAFSSGTSSRSRAVLCSAVYMIRPFRTPSGSHVSLL